MELGAVTWGVTGELSLDDDEVDEDNNNDSSSRLELFKL